MSVSLDNQPVRAEVYVGDLGTISTPYVVSFNVRKSRGQMCSTFQASLKIDIDELASTTDVINENIIIKAGLRGSLKTIFTGKVFSCVINPVRTDASKVMLNLTGKDVLCRLEGQKINRRIKTYRDGSDPPGRVGYINSVSRKNIPIRQKFKTKLFTDDPTCINTNLDERVIKTFKAYTDSVVDQKVREISRSIIGSDIQSQVIERGGQG